MEGRASRPSSRARTPGHPLAGVDRRVAINVGNPCSNRSRGYDANSCFRKSYFGIYNDGRVSDLRSLRDFLAAGARVAPVVQVRSEGADGNVCASRVGKETLARAVHAGLLPFVDI